MLSRIGAEYGERCPERVTQRNGYRSRAWDTRVGTMDLHIPKLREGSYFPSLLELLRKGGMDGDVDFLREALRVLVEGIMDA